MKKLKSTKGKANLVDLYDSLISDYGFCGFLALLQGLLNCINQNFSFEEILKKLVEASLKGFTPLQMVKFLELLPSDKRIEVINKVDAVLKQNDIFNEFLGTFADQSNAIEIVTNQNYEDQKIYESDIALEEEANTQNQSEEEFQTATNPASNDSEVNIDILLKQEIAKAVDLTTTISDVITDPEQKAIDSINATTEILIKDSTTDNRRPQLAKGSLALGQIQSIIMKAYIDAFLELVNAEELYAIILRFPGVKLVAQFIDSANCAKPDMKEVTFLNFLHTLEVEWCRLNFEITFPQITIPDIGAFLSNLWKALAEVVSESIIKLIYKIINEILMKIMEILINSLCNLLSTISNAILTGQNVGTELLDLLRETFGCPPITTSEQEQALLEAVGQIFGGQAGVGSQGFTTQEVASVLQNVSVSLTPYELSDFLKGKLSADKTTYLRNVLSASDPKFMSLFPDEGSLASVFSTLGNLVPDNILDEFENRASQFIDSLFPTNTSVCGTPESIEKFKNLREQLLSDRGLSPEEIKTQLDGMKERADENLTFIADLASKGIGNVVGEKLAASLLGESALQDPNSVFNNNSGCNPGLYSSPYSSELVKSYQEMGNKSLFDSLRSIYLNDLFKEPNIFDGIGKKPVAFLNAVLADKNARDFVKHNKRTDDLFFRLYNSEEHSDDISKTFPLPFDPNKKGIEENYFPTYVSKFTKIALNSYVENSDLVFKNETLKYRNNKYPKRFIFGKKEDFSLNADVMEDLGKKYNLLYSQFVLSGSSISSDNLSRVYLSTEFSDEVKPKNKPDAVIENEPPEGTITHIQKINEQVNITYQSRYSLDEGITALKDIYMPASLVYSPQADSFINYMNEKILAGQYSITINNDIEFFNSVSDRMMKFVISTLTTDENSFKFGYEWTKEKVTQEDIELDSETLERRTENPRVIFLDYEKYGGTEENPAVYIKPVERIGWLGVADSVIPELGCEPTTEKIVYFEELNQLVNELQRTLPDDPKLMYSEDCRELLPYAKALSSVMAANLQVGIVTTMRVYISEAILRCIPLFDKYVVTYDKVIDELYIDYILKKMQEGLTNQGKGLFDVKSDEYYLYFLEQCVQIVSRQVVNGDIQLSVLEQAAFDVINKMIQNFYFIKEKDYSILKNSFDLLGNLRIQALSFKSVIRSSSPNSSIYDDAYTRVINEIKTASQTYSQFTPYIQKIENLSEQYKNDSLNQNYLRQLKIEIDNLLTEIVYVQRDYLNTLDSVLVNVLYNCSVKNGNVKVPTLKKLRKEMVLEAIRQTREEAKIITKIILRAEMETMFAKFAATIYSQPKITNVRKHFLDTNTNLILPKSRTTRYFDVAKDLSDNPLLQLAPEIIADIGSNKIKIDLSRNQNGYFILERYMKIEDRVVPLSGTIVPQEIYNRPSNLNGVINVYDFKDWISTLSEETKNKQIYQLFGDLSVTGSQNSGFQLTGSTIGLKYGLRISMVMPDRYIAGSTRDPNTDLRPESVNIQQETILYDNSVAKSEKAYELAQAKLNGGILAQNSQYIVPIASAEIDFVDDKLGNFNPDIGLNKYDHDCLVKALYDSNQFRFLFYYCVPIQKHLSAIATFINEFYVKLIGTSEGDEWVSTPLVSFEEPNFTFHRTKEHCQIFFETFYNWENTQYNNIKLKRLLEGSDTLIERMNNSLRPIGPLVLTDWRVKRRNPFDQNGNECDILTEEND